MAEPAESTQPNLDRLLATIAGKGDLPAAARLIQRLHDAVRNENCNALEVARIILADPGLSSKVLRVVNSSFYRPRGEPVSTITRAVILLGFETIRDLTTGLLVVDEIMRAAGGRVAIRDVLHQCLLCASVSRALSTSIGYPNPEEAYLLGLFANWGELCLAAYYPDDYEQAARRARIESLPLERTLGEVFGVASTEVATAMLGRWDFPPSYSDYFRLAHPDGEHPVTSSGQRLFAIVDIANAYAAHAAEVDPEAPVDVDAVRRFETMFARRGEALIAAIQSGVAELEEESSVRRLVGAPASTTGRGADHRAAATVRSGATPDASLPLHPVAAPVSPSTAAAFEILAEISRAILAQENINDTLAMVLEGVARLGHYDVVFLALLNARKDHLVGRLGYGDGVGEYLSRLSVPLAADAGVLATCVLAREPRIVPEGSGAMLVPRGAPATDIPAASFIAHPLVVRGKAVGVLVAARGPSNPRVTRNELTMVQLFCNQAGLALDRAVG